MTHADPAPKPGADRSIRRHVFKTFGLPDHDKVQVFRVQRAEAFIEQVLLPELQPGDVVIIVPAAKAPMSVSRVKSGKVWLEPGTASNQTLPLSKAATVSSTAPTTEKIGP